MDTRYADYRQKWRQRRRRIRLRRLPLVVAGVLLLIGIAALSARAHRPQLGAVAWADGDGYHGMPHIGLGEGALVVAWEYGSVTAHAAITGAPLWLTPFDRAHPFDGPPAVGGDRIVLGGSDGYVRCLELKTGEVAWGFDTETIVRSTPLILKDRVYVGGDDGRLYCLRLDDGTKVWAYPPTDEADREAILGGPAVDDGVIVCGSCEREAYGLDLATGKVRWHLPLDGPVIARATVDSGLAYVAVENGLVRCVSARDGATAWEKQVPFLVRQPVVVHRHRAFILSSDGTVYCVEAKTGQDLWTRKLRGRPTTSGTGDDRGLYVGTSDGVVQALSPDDGQTVWQWRCGSKPLSDLLLDAEHLYCTTSNGRVFAVRIGAPG
jgi:outer membrane protein assembly factor BamB